VNDEEKIRSFLAIDLPSEIKNGLGKIQDRLKTQISGIRWTNPQGIHLTFKFFGDLSKNELSMVSESVSDAVVKVSPFSLSIEGLGVFPGVKRPRVVWIGMTGEQNMLSALQQDIDMSLEKRGFQKEERGFKPHLTLGRFRSIGETRGLNKILEKRDEFQAGDFIAEGITLFRSDLTPKGAVYSVLAFFPFKKKQDRTKTPREIKFIFGG